MRCKRAQQLVSRRIDGELSGSNAAALDRHFAYCPACRLGAERLERAWSVLASLESSIKAPDDWERIEAAVEVKNRKWTLRWPSWQLPPVPSTAAWLLVGMVLLGATGGVLISRTVLPPVRSVSIEVGAFAETFSVLPWNSPAEALAVAFDARPSKEERP
jgi:predicted anti-sigma-YlaC factor YlaD